MKLHPKTSVPFGMSALIVLACTLNAAADPPNIEAVRYSNGSLHVTVSHPDTGWDHYADLWEVFDAEGNKIAERVLLHPHETEQPFTRSTLAALEGINGPISVLASCTEGDASEPFIFEPAS